MKAGSVLSRTFSSKDTHTPRGELLVVYGSARQSYRDAQIAHETAAVSFDGFSSFAFSVGFRSDACVSSRCLADPSMCRSHTSSSRRCRFKPASVPAFLFILRSSDLTPRPSPMAPTSSYLWAPTPSCGPSCPLGRMRRRCRASSAT